MTEEEFFVAVRRVVSECLPSEVRAFDLGARPMVTTLFKGKKIKIKGTRGETGAIGADEIKLILEYIPVLHACYELFRHHRDARKKRKPLPPPSPEELRSLILESGCRQDFANRVSTEHRALFAAFTLDSAS